MATHVLTSSDWDDLCDALGHVTEDGAPLELTWKRALEMIRDIREELLSIREKSEESRPTCPELSKGADEWTAGLSIRKEV